MARIVRLSYRVLIETVDSGVGAPLTPKVPLLSMRVLLTSGHRRHRTSVHPFADFELIRPPFPSILPLPAGR